MLFGPRACHRRLAAFAAPGLFINALAMDVAVASIGPTFTDVCRSNSTNSSDRLYQDGGTSIVINSPETPFAVSPR